jgi:hypothetical protein
MYVKLAAAFTTDGLDWGVKIFGTNHGQAALQACIPGTWCWISVTGAASMGDSGFVKLNANDITSAFDAEIKQLTVEEFGKEVDPLAAPQA